MVTNAPNFSFAQLATQWHYFLIDQGMLDGVQIFFENQFVEAQRIFATQDQVNPVYALGSGALAFMKGKLKSTKQLPCPHPHTVDKMDM